MSAELVPFQDADSFINMKMRARSGRNFVSQPAHAVEFQSPNREQDRTPGAQTCMSRFWLFPLAIFLSLPPALAANPAELTLAERQALMTQIERCVPPTNMTTRSVTTIDLRLNPDGSLAAESKVIASPTAEIGKAMLRAASMCGPYRLPAQKYEKWKQILLDFDLGPPNQN
jgi:hypothetical protein